MLDVKKALHKRLVMLSGDESALRMRGLDALVEVATADGDFDLETFDAGESRPVDWIGAASTAPFLSLKRTVIVRHLLRADDLEQAFGTRTPSIALPESALLILVADEEQGDESKQKRLSTVRQKWEKLVTSQGGLVTQFKVSGDAIKETIRDEAAKQGKSLTGAALQLLVEMTGESASRALEELEKLVLYAEGSQIGESDVREAVVASREWQIFKMVDAIISGRIGEALTHARLLAATSKPESAVYGAILPQVSRQLKLLWQARLCLDAKANLSSLPDDLAGCFPTKPNLASEKDWIQRKAMQGARNLRLDQIARCLQFVSDADARLKGMLPGFSTIETVERLVLEMAEALKPQPLAIRR